MNKKEVAKILEEIGELLDIKGENPFKVRSYYNASRTISTLQEDIDTLVNQGRLREIKGIGEALNNKITELVTTGKLKYYEDLKASLPEGLIDLLSIPSLGPRKIKTLYEKLNITNIGELEYACKENRLVSLEGFGPKSQQNILEGIKFKRKYDRRFLYPEVEKEGQYLLERLKGLKGIIRISVAGSLRRKCETVKDIDILISAEPEFSNDIMNTFCSLDRVEKVIAQGDTKSSIMLDSGINSDLRVVSDEQYPYALHYFTGSKEHNVEMRRVAKKFNRKLNEYGLFEEEKNIPCKDEEELFEALGLQYIPPELRESFGEIEAAQKNQIPKLLEENDIRGLFHIHSNYSDGVESIENIVKKCIELGYEYVGICDHSKSAYYANGLTEERIIQQHREIDALQGKYSQIKIFKGIEVDIASDGSLDYNDDILKSFDVVIGAIHSKLKMTAEEAMERMVKALRNPEVDMIAHPTGRLLLAREPYPLNINHFLEEAAKYGKIIELNANPHRLDLDWMGCKYAKGLGVKVCINPDAHSLIGLNDMKYGIGIARKGWLEKEDILNSLSVKELQEKYFDAE
ncbi:DNA polymerase/3'-5' exonuclease PolX [bacterium]|nr:DNA polymerase/3'-5' exonuclease PolX [bacterium]